MKYIPKYQQGYIIQKGDTLSALAKKHNTTVKELATANNISNPDLIIAGNKLNIPKKYDKELTLNEIPQEYHPNRVIDNFSPHYDYLVQGDKLYYQTKGGKTWADISENTPAKRNIYKYLQERYQLKGYSDKEKSIWESLSQNKYDYDKAYADQYQGQLGTKPAQENISFNTEEEYKASFLKPFDPKLKEAQLQWAKYKTASNKTSKVNYNPAPLVTGKTINTSLLPNYPSGPKEPRIEEPGIWEGIKNTFNAGYDKLDLIKDLGINYIKRRSEKQSEEREPNTSFNPVDINVDSKYSIREPAQTGDTIRLNATRYYLPEVIDLSKVTVGARNRGDYSPLKTEGAIATTFSPFIPKSQIRNAGVADSFIGISNNQLKVGSITDFQDNDQITKTYKNRVIDFVRDNNGNIVYTKRNKDNPNNPVPNVIIENDKGERVTGSLNVLTKRGKADEGTYGNITGGRMIMKAGNETKLVSGSMIDIEREFNKLKKVYGAVDIYTLDNGTYTKGLRTYNQQIDSKELKGYDRSNSSGGNFAYLTGKTPLVKYKENIYQTPNIRTEKDKSYQMGHPLVNETKAVILHHTAYTDTNLGAVHKYFMTPGNNSSHVIINYNGERNVYAQPEQVTFHAGESKFNGRDNVNDFALGIEFQGDTNKKRLTKEQIESAVEYLYPIVLKHKIPLENITTHARIAKGRKPDINEIDYNSILEILKQRIYESKEPQSLAKNQKGGILKYQKGKSLVPIYKTQQEADTALNPTGYTVKPVEKKSEVAEYMKKQDAENMKRRLASDVYTDPSTGKTVVQSQGITPVASPIDFAVGGIGLIASGGSKLLLSGINQAVELVNPLPTSYKDLASRFSKQRTAALVSKLENPLYLEKAWGRLNSSSKFTQDPLGYTVQLPFNTIKKNINKKDTDLVDQLLETHINWDDNTARTALTNKRLKLEKWQDKVDKVYQDVSTKVTPTLIDFKKPLGTGAQGTAYPTKKINNVVKFGSVPNFETAESLKLITKAGKENTNFNIGLPTVIHKVDNVDSQDIYAQVMKRVPGEPIVGSLKVEQSSLDEMQVALENLRTNGIHLDYANPRNILYDKSTGKLSAVDFNTTPPPGSSFNAINKIHGTIKENLDDRFVHDLPSFDVLFSQ